MAEYGPIIERDGGRIILKSNDSTYIIIDKDKIILKGTIIVDGDVDIKGGADGMICGTSIASVKNGIVVGIH